MGHRCRRGCGRVCTCKTEYRKEEGCKKSCCSGSKQCGERNDICYRGTEVECLNIRKGDRYDEIIHKLSNFICENGFDIQTVDHTRFSESTGDPADEPGQIGQTDTYIIWGDDEETIVLGEFTVTNGIEGPRGNGILGTQWVSNSNSSPANTPGTTDTYAVNYDDGGQDMFTVYNGKDGINGTNGTNGVNANSEYGKTLFVDTEYGNNSTGTRERFDLPYLKISSALLAASPGDTVWVRSGEYTENITLRDGVNIHFEQALLVGKITDNGQRVTSRITGALRLNYVLGKTVHLTGGGSKVDIKMNEIKSNGAAIWVEQSTGEEIQLTMELNRIVGGYFDYALTVRGKGSVNLIVKDRIETVAMTSPEFGYATIKISGAHQGRINVQCPYVFIGNSEEFFGGQFYTEDETVTEMSRVDIRIDRIENIYSGVVSGGIGVISKAGKSDSRMKIGKLTSKTRIGVLVIGDAATGKLDYEGEVEVEDNVAFMYASNQKTTVRNSRLVNRNIGGIYQQAFAVGQLPTLIGVAGAISTGYKLNVKDSVIARYGTTGDSKGVIEKEGVPVVTFHNTNIYDGATTPASSIKTTGGTNKDLYLQGVNSNVALDSTTVTDISVTGGFNVEPSLVEYL